MALLEIKNLVKNYGDVEALKGINLSIEKGEVVVILGPSGCGKSTFLRCLNGLEEIKSGQILLDNCKLSEMSSKQIAQKIAYVSQLSPQTYQYRVRDYVVLGRAAHLGVLDKPSEADFALVDEALNKLGISHFADRKQ